MSMVLFAYLSKVLPSDAGVVFLEVANQAITFELLSKVLSQLFCEEPILFQVVEQVVLRFTWGHISNDP